MQEQVILAASRTESNIVAWDLVTGTSLTQYKGNSAAPNCLCRLGSDYLVAAQLTKDSLHFWTWHKDSVLQRSFMMERGVSVAATADGMYLAVGSATGNISVWEVASGQLLVTWPAHYKAVSTLCFLDGGHVLVSGGEDALVCVWMMADCVDCTRDPNNPSARIQAFYTWSEHTLPITSVGCSAGEASALILTTALDRTLKIWSMATGGILRSVQLPSPLHSLVLDAGGQAVYAGGADGGIYEVSLVGDAPVDIVAGNLGQQSLHFLKLEGHSGVVNSMALSLDGELLVSGSEDGAVRVWDVRSRQTVRVLHLSAKVPVSTVLVLPRPPYLQPVGQQSNAAAAAAGSQGIGEGRKGPKCPNPLAPFSKFQGTASSLKPWEGAPVVLDHPPPYQGISSATRSLMPLMFPPTSSGSNIGGSIRAAVAAAAAANGASGLGSGRVAAAAEGAGDEGGFGGGMGKISELEEEVAMLKKQLEAATQSARQWQSMHAELHMLCVEEVLGRAQDSIKERTDRQADGRTDGRRG